MTQKKANKPIVAQQKQELRAFRREVRLQSGPLPDPKVLAMYDETLPGTSQKIVDAFVSQTQHRMQMECRQMELKQKQMSLLERYATIESRNSLIGLLFAGTMGAATIGLGAYLVYNGNNVGGTLFSGAGLAAILTAFIYGTKASHEKTK